MYIAGWNEAAPYRSLPWYKEHMLESMRQKPSDVEQQLDTAADTIILGSEVQLNHHPKSRCYSWRDKKNGGGRCAMMNYPEGWYDPSGEMTKYNLELPQTENEQARPDR